MCDDISDERIILIHDLQQCHNGQGRKLGRSYLRAQGPRVLHEDHLPVNKNKKEEKNDRLKTTKLDK